MLENQLITRLIILLIVLTINWYRDLTRCNMNNLMAKLILTLFERLNYKLLREIKLIQRIYKLNQYRINLKLKPKNPTMIRLVGLHLY